jgi:hypothetical protein
LICYKGYDLKKKACVLAELQKPKDFGCKLWDWDHQKCLECSARFVFDADGYCFQVSNDCASHDASGSCTSCYKGYKLNSGACVLAELQKPKDFGCKLWDWDHQKCLECSARFVFDADGYCFQVSNDCASHDASGSCTSCYKGYKLNSGACVLAELQKPKDFGCKLWDWDHQKCLECSARFVFDADGYCFQVSNDCASHDASGSCTSCYKGYKLNSGACVLAELQKPKDFGCKLWDWDHQKCLECSARFVFDADGYCFQVSNDCASHDASGSCTSCYQGY